MVLIIVELDRIVLNEMEWNGTEWNGMMLSTIVCAVIMMQSVPTNITHPASDHSEPFSPNNSWRSAILDFI